MNIPSWQLDRVSTTLDTTYALPRVSADIVNVELGYVQLPAFNIPQTWLGASEIIKQYNFSVPSSFSLMFQSAPTNGTFCACVRYRVGASVFRRKLWQYVDEALYVPLYAGEIIKPNFSIEIWSVYDETAILTDPLNFYLSLIHKPTAFCSGAILAPESDYTACATLKCALPFDGGTELLDVGDCSAHLTN